MLGIWVFGQLLDVIGTVIMLTVGFTFVQSMAIWSWLLVPCHQHVPVSDQYFDHDSPH